MYSVISFSHKNTALELREKLSMDDSEILDFMSSVLGLSGLSEVMVVSTCNRFEVYMYCQTTDGCSFLGIKDGVLGSISARRGLAVSDLLGVVNYFENLDAVRHVFCVASSLDSAIVGETQVSGQFREAYRLSHKNGFCSKYLTSLVSFALRCASGVRSSAELFSSTPSIASVAVSNLLGKIGDSDTSYGDIPRREGSALTPRVALVIGIGKIGKLSARRLLANGFSVAVCNRTQDSVSSFISEVIRKNPKYCSRIYPVPFGELFNRFNDFSVVFVAVSGGLLIRNSDIQKRDFDRYWYDLSVPTSIADLSAMLYDVTRNISIARVDDLSLSLMELHSIRDSSSASAYGVVDDYVRKFDHFLSCLSVNDVIRLIRRRAASSVDKELERAIKKGFISESMRLNISKLLGSAMNTFLHLPTVNIKSAAVGGNRSTVLKVVSELFDERELAPRRCRHKFDPIDSK